MKNNPIKIGLTEPHGMVKEYSQFPPEGVEYSFLSPTKGASKILQSPMKGYFRRFESDKHDLIEATLCPILTKNNWIYSIANFQEALAFNFCGAPLPRFIRAAYMKHIFLKDNFKKLIFWSEAGRKTLNSYGNISDKRILEKTAVVYPAIRQVPDELIRHNTDKVNILFSGDFFRKGGVNVVDAFDRIQKDFPHTKLILCCDEKLDFNTGNIELRKEYIDKIKNNSKIDFRGRVSREIMMNQVFPDTDIYLLPTYAEAFGYAVLEAMAYGIPVIATNIFAIPEIVEDKSSGLLIDVNDYNCEEIFKGYIVNEIPLIFRNYVTEQLIENIGYLVSSKTEREKFGNEAIKKVRDSFSMEKRIQKMNSIYSSLYDL